PRRSPPCAALLPYTPLFRSVSVNVSPAQFMSEELDPAAWLACVTRQGLPVSAVLIEITERVLLKADSAAKNKLLAFRDAGVQLRSEEHTSELQSRENLVCRP